MQIKKSNWLQYVKLLEKIDKKASDMVLDYLSAHSILTDTDLYEMLDFVYGVVTKYNEASAAAACEMYDAVALAEGAHVPPAVPADTPSYSDVAKTVNGARRFSSNPQVTADASSRLVKRTGVDTTVNNALRDGAEWAWIPSGDTCAFCLTLASRGWQKASKKALKNGHASHIHANCNCTYAIRFDGESTIDGYDPDALLAAYRAAEGDTPEERINSLRRTSYAKNRDRINAQKRAAYESRKKNSGDNGSGNANGSLPPTTAINRGKDVTKQYKQDATPRQGNITYEPGFDYKNRQGEARAAKIIHEKLGGNIIVKEERPGQKNPDYEWMGTLWDLKTTSTEKSANSAIRSGMKQIRDNPGGLFLDFGENEISMDTLLSVIERRMRWYPDDCADIVIISKGEIITVLRY